MAKKTISVPVYPEAPLTITRERFCELLTEQIQKGTELLSVDVPKLPQPSPYYGGFATMHRGDKVVYDETAKNTFISDYKRWRDRNKAIYRTSFEVAESIYYHDYESQIWQIWGTDTIKEYKDNIQRQINQMKGDIERADLIGCVVDTVAAVVPIQAEEPKKLSSDVFIVHGHNNEMKQAVARTISTLGLNPIVLHEQPNAGKTIIEKFESNAKRITFAVILLSADDLAASVRELDGIKNEEIKGKLSFRARENVVFEMGYFAGKLNRSNVFFLLQEGVSKPGDLDGIVYTAYDSSGAWRFELVKELKAAGYPVSADALL